MEKVCQLVETALEQVAWPHRQGMIPRALSHHTSADSVKQCSHHGDYDDRGNWLGSVTMLILLFPETYHPKYDTRWVSPGLITYLNGAGDRREPLMYTSQSRQVSGKRCEQLSHQPLGGTTCRAWRTCQRFAGLVECRSGALFAPAVTTAVTTTMAR